MNAVRLEAPHAGLLPGYVAALRTGWSPSNEQDVSGAHLAAIEADAAGFLAAFEWAPGQMALAADGTMQPRLEGPTFWIVDDEFCGRINLRYVRGTVDLPPYATGHIGYAVVPWKRRQGIATAALRLVLPLAHAAGLERVMITSNPKNLASHGVIRAAGGEFAGLRPNGSTFGFWVPTQAAMRSQPEG